MPNQPVDSIPLEPNILSTDISSGLKAGDKRSVIENFFMNNEVFSLLYETVFKVQPPQSLLMQPDDGEIEKHLFNTTSGQLD